MDGTNEIKVLTYPNTILRNTAESVTNIDDDLQNLVALMIKIMYASSGIGLAANQIGELKRVIVFDQNPGTKEQKAGVLINPEIISREGEIIYKEACLSIIDFTSDVSRNSRIHVRGHDQHGNQLDIEASDLSAICLQHEIDHLNGQLFIDHISNLKRSMYKRRLNKELKKAQKKGS